VAAASASRRVRFMSTSSCWQLLPFQMCSVPRLRVYAKQFWGTASSIEMGEAVEMIRVGAKPAEPNSP